MATTADGSSATLFRLRGEAEALALTAKLEAEQERRHRFDADQRRTSEMDDLMDRLAKNTDYRGITHPSISRGDQTAGSGAFWEQTA